MSGPMEWFDLDVTKSETGKGLNIERYDMSIYQRSFVVKGIGKPITNNTEANVYK